MGLNVDLCHMLGVPEQVQCPRCRATTTTFFDDYDIQCGNPNPAPGLWSLTLCCRWCEHEWRIEYRIELQPKERYD